MIWDPLGLEEGGQISHYVVSNIVDPPRTLWTVT
jgi:hypothetical protein